MLKLQRFKLLLKRNCYDQGLGETLVQQENETPLFLFPKHHQQ